MISFYFTGKSKEIFILNIMIGQKLFGGVLIRLINWVM